MRKYQLDLSLTQISEPRPGYVLLQLTDPSGPLPDMLPGQFVEVRVDTSSSTFLRRPISINLVDRQNNELWLLVHVVGAGTRALSELSVGSRVNVVLPLGRGFTMPQPYLSVDSSSGSSVSEVPSPGSATSSPRYLLVGGGVGTAPLLYLGQELVRQGCRPTFLLGGRTASDLLQLDFFRRCGDVYLTTEDGSAGERGFVTQHTLWQNAVSSDSAAEKALASQSGLDEHVPTSPIASSAAIGNHFDRICTCGPKPMMMAVARLAREKGIPCEASLENLMACGLGACLCCVEDTVDGHVCVCTEGPVFSTDKLKW